MVQQLSLVGTLPHTKYIQTMSTLQALTGIQSPQDISTYTLLCKPYLEFKPKVEPGKINQIEQHYMKCITTWDDVTSKSLDMAEPIYHKLVDDEKELQVWVDTLFSDKTDRQDKRNWTLQICDIPTAGKNQTCSVQTVYESTMIHHHAQQLAPKKAKPEPETVGDDAMQIGEKATAAAADAPHIDSFLQFLQDLGYEVTNQYWIKGVRYFYGDIFIDTFKVFVRDDDIASSNNKLKLKLLDATNTFQVKVYVNVPRVTDIELMNAGIKDMQRFQDYVKNLLTLEIPDRMSMDSRVLKG